jgi:CARDB
MSSNERRAAARRRAWGRGPIILRFEPLEGRQLLATSVVGPTPDLLATSFSTIHSAYWGDLIHATGTIANQGTATTVAPVSVQIYGSTSPILGSPGSSGMLLGTAIIPAGLTPGSSYNFDQIVGLPPSTLTGASPSQTLYVALSVDPFNAVPEGSTIDKVGRGLGIDTSVLTITPHQPANLVGSSIAVTPLVESTPGDISWGDTFSVTEQIKNTGQGDAPPTRARIVLTPVGATPGAYSDVTIGNIQVPAIPAFQTTNVVQTITLPAIEPSTLGNATQFTISVVQDADFLTQPVYPAVATQGVGLDQGPIGISPGPLAATPPGPLPDLAPASVVVSQTSLSWGEQFQVGAVIQNVGLGDSGPFRVRFVATSVTGDVSHGIFLGDTMVSGLAANSAVSVLAPVQFPSKLPFGTTVANPSYLRIYAIADPEDVVSESTRSNNMASSAPVLLSVLTSNGSAPANVPTYPQNIYTVPVLAAKAAKTTAQATLGKPKPASTKPVKKHKPDFLASLSEGIAKGVEKQIKAIPKGFNDFLHNIGVSGNSSGGAGANPANTAATATTTTTTNAASSFGANTSGGTGGFGASGVSSTLGP